MICIQIVSYSLTRLSRQQKVVVAQNEIDHFFTLNGLGYIGNDLLNHDKCLSRLLRFTNQLEMLPRIHFVSIHDGIS